MRAAACAGMADWSAKCLSRFSLRSAGMPLNVAFPAKIKLKHDNYHLDLRRNTIIMCTFALRKPDGME